MAVVGIGMDLVEIRRIERSFQRFGESFAARVLSPAELACLPKSAVRRTEFLAGRFAAKEASVKALGTGFADGVSFADIEILPNQAGAPQMHLTGRAADLARSLGVARLHVTLTHTDSVAAAVVVMEGTD